LTGEAKDGLYNAYNELISSIDNLIQVINDTIADNIATDDETKSVDNAFSVFNSQYASYSNAVEIATKCIMDAIDKKADNAISAAQSAQDAADQAKQDIISTNDSITDLSNYIDNAFKDGIIDEAEAKAITTYINNINATKAAVEASYNELSSNTYLTGDAKTALVTAYKILVSTIDDLLSTINAAISDGKTTSDETAKVNDKFSQYNKAYANYQTAVEAATNYIVSVVDQKAIAAQNTANDAVEAAANAQSSANQALKDASTANIAVGDLNDYVDESFRDGIITQTEAQALATYINNLNATKASLSSSFTQLYNNTYLKDDAKDKLKNAYESLVKAIDALINSVKTAIADDKTTDEEKDDVDNKYGLFNSAYANYSAVVEQASNYILDQIYAAAQAAQNTANQAVKNAQDAQTSADNAMSKANDVADDVTSLSEYVDNSFKDNIIDNAEALAMETYINNVRSTQQAVDGSYNELFSNSYITTATQKNLKSAYDTFNTTVDNLINGIKSAIEDGKITEDEKSYVTKLFTTFYSALNAFNKAVESAYNDISQNILISADVASKEEVAKLGETIIEGGYIKTELIKATELIIRHVLLETGIDGDNRKIEISPDNMEMDMYDTNGDLCTTFEGNTYDSISTLFGDSSGVCSILTRTSTLYGYGSGVSLGHGKIDQLNGSTGLSTSTYRNTIPITNVWKTDTPTEVSAKGSIYAFANSYTDTTTSSDTNNDNLVINQMSVVVRFFRPVWSVFKRLCGSGVDPFWGYPQKGLCCRC
jgi:hypothetical protein